MVVVLTFVRRLERKSDVYIIMLTALDEEVDIVTGYDLGADDYITKPFSLMVLISKVNALMKRVNTVKIILYWFVMIYSFTI